MIAIPPSKGSTQSILIVSSNTDVVGASGADGINAQVKSRISLSSDMPC